MAAPTPRATRKRMGRYHHGDLRQALLAAALRMIQKHGAASLTLRAVGQDLGVSRTALYRHFADKAALLAAVGTDGFRRFRLALLDAWQRDGKGLAGFAAIGAAYVRFAADHPSHYRVMFGGALHQSRRPEPDLVTEGRAAFRVLVDALIELQRDGLVQAGDPHRQAVFVWSTVHGIAMLAIDGQLNHEGVDPIALVQFGMAHLMDGIRTPASHAPSSPK